VINVVLYVNILDVKQSDAFFYTLLVPDRFRVGEYIGPKSIDDCWILYDFSLPEPSFAGQSKTVTVEQREDAIVQLLTKKKIRAYVRPKGSKPGPKPAKKK